MDMRRQQAITIETQNTVSDLLQSRRRHEMHLFIVLFITLLGFTSAFMWLEMKNGFSIALGIIAALALALALIRWPILGLYAVAASALLIEQQALSTPIFTDHLYVFYWPTQLEGFFERPIGLVILLTFFIWIVFRLLLRKPLLRGGALWFPFLFFMLCVVGGVIYGLAKGGDVKIIVLEVRPFWYMFTSYLLAYNLLTKKSHLRNFLWLAIVSAGVKALQGLYIYYIVYHGHLQPGQDSIMSHEESFFFAAALLLVIIFSLHYRYRPQFITALCLTPIVIFVLVANQRRTDYIALLIGFLVAWVLTFQIKPQARGRLVVILITILGLGTAYVLAFQHSTSSIGSPARSIVAIFNPSATDTRNADSNLYRVYEDNDLKYTAKQNPLGIGFGNAFLQPQSLTSIFPDVLVYDPYYNYVPHNTIYWIWTDLGLIGYFALWFLFGSIIVVGSITTRKLKDPYLQVISIYIVGVTMMEVIAAYADYQLFFFRNVIYLGLLCGILARLPALDQQDQQVQQQKDIHTNELTNGVATPSRPLVGSRNT